MKELKRTCLVLCYWSVLASVNGLCGYPGTPLNGSVQISFDSDVKVAEFTCLTSLIEGPQTRRCERGKWSGTLPLCARNMPIQHIEAEGSDAKLFNDQNSRTCDWFKSGNELKLKLESASRITSVTLISPNDYKDSLKSSKLELTVDGVRVNGKTNGTFHESIVTGDHFYNFRWPLNISGHELNLSPLEGNLYLCEVVIQTYPKECGHPEIPVEGNATDFGHQAVYYCKSPFILIGNVVRNCSHGKWTGDQPICTISSTSNVLPTSLVIFIGYLFCLTITTIIPGV